MSAQRNRYPAILVVCLGGIGDVLLSTALVRSLRRAWPDSSVDMLVRSGRDGVLDGNPDVRRVLTVSGHPGLAEWVPLARRVVRRYSLALSTGASDRHLLYARLAGRSAVSLVRDRERGRWKHRLLTRAVPLRSDVHALSNQLRLAAALGVPPTDAPVAPPPSSVAPDVGPPGARLAVVHVCPRNVYKRWSAEGWRAVLRHLVSRGLTPVLTGGRDADERRYVAEIARSTPEALVVSGALDLREVADVLRRAELYVGVDTAVSHLAAATGTPSVVVFGPTDPATYGPWPVGHPPATSPYAGSGSQGVGCVSLVKADCSCGPPYPEGCEGDPGRPSRCLAELPAEPVIEAVDARLRAGRAAVPGECDPIRSSTAV